MNDMSLADSAALRVKTILTDIFMPAGRVMLVHDGQSALSKLLTEAYLASWPAIESISFDDTQPSRIIEILEQLSPGDLVILVQSSSFRLDEFRIRVHLFARGLKVIEHPHLSRVSDDEFQTYIDALAYDAAYYRTLGPLLKTLLDGANEVTLTCEDHLLTYSGPMEPAKLNIGDYAHMKNVGGQFPIGEVFTELKDLTQLNGRVGLFAFGDKTFSVYGCDEPIVLTIEAGRVVEVQNSVPAFDEVLDDIRKHEGQVWVRELGFGLNPALTREKRIRHDVGIYERMCGVHVSLGAKHALYPKEGFRKRQSKFHVDAFVALNEAAIDGRTIYRDGVYLDTNSINPLERAFSR